MFSSEKYPRVLVINGEPISAPTATGLTLENLFFGWPSDRLAQVFTSPLPHNRHSDFEYRLRPTERIVLSGVRRLANRKQAAGVEAQGTPVRAGSPAQGRAGGALRSTVRMWLDSVAYRLPANVEQQLMKFKPDIVYTCLGGIQIASLAQHCSRLCNVGIVPHFMDDWISTLYANRLDLFLQRKHLLRATRRVMKRVSVGMSISDLMAEEYASSFGIPFHSFMNCVSVPAEMNAEPPIDPTAGLRLVYVGGLHLERWQSLKEIAEALIEINSEGLLGKLVIYSPAEDIKQFGAQLRESGAEIAGSLAQADVPNALRGANVLVHVESFGKQMRKYTRLSISTKIPQYMAAARPVFYYGPGEVGSCRFIEDNHCGLVVGQQDRSALVAALRMIAKDANVRKELGKAAWAKARQKFDTSVVREQFRSLLVEAARAC